MHTTPAYDIRDFLNGNESTKEAFIRFSKKQIKKKRTKKNKKPERAIQKQIYSWSRSVGMELSITDASAFNHMHESPFPVGHSDLTGDDRNGIAVYIEAKAPGRLKNLTSQQYEFLKNKIERGCFAIVSDSVERTEKLYNDYINLRKQNKKSEAIELLISELPIKKSFEEDFSIDD